MNGAVSHGDNTVSSISASSLSSECKHKDGPRCFSKSKVRFCVPGCWGGEMRSLQTDITYGLITSNSGSKESKSLVNKCFILQLILVETQHSPLLAIAKCVVYKNNVTMAAQTATLIQNISSFLCVGSL